MKKWVIKSQSVGQWWRGLVHKTSIYTCSSLGRLMCVHSVHPHCWSWLVLHSISLQANPPPIPDIIIIYNVEYAFPSRIYSFHLHDFVFGCYFISSLCTNEGTKVQNPLRLCHIYTCIIIANLVPLALWVRGMITKNHDYVFKECLFKVWSYLRVSNSLRVCAGSGLA